MARDVPVGLLASEWGWGTDDGQTFLGSHRPVEGKNAATYRIQHQWLAHDGRKRGPPSASTCIRNLGFPGCSDPGNVSGYSRREFCNSAGGNRKARRAREKEYPHRDDFCPDETKYPGSRGVCGTCRPPRCEYRQLSPPDGYRDLRG